MRTVKAWHEVYRSAEEAMVLPPFCTLNFANQLTSCPDDFTEYYGLPRRFVVKDVEGTLAKLQKQEDTDGNAQITIEDKGPKVSQLLILSPIAHIDSDTTGVAAWNSFFQRQQEGCYPWHLHDIKPSTRALPC